MLQKSLAAWQLESPPTPLPPIDLPNELLLPPPMHRAPQPPLDLSSQVGPRPVHQPQTQTQTAGHRNPKDLPVPGDLNFRLSPSLLCRLSGSTK